MGLPKKKKIPEIGLCPYPALKFSDMNFYRLSSMPISQWLPSILSGIDYLLCAKHIWDPDIAVGSCLKIACILVGILFLLKLCIHSFSAL